MTTFASRPAGIAASSCSQPVHPKGTNARVLLTSVFGPYARDDEYGSRLINPMELYQNQVTREQKAFSLRMFHRSWGLALIQENIEAHCALLDFPTLDRFIEEITTRHYDVVGVSGIVPNIGKIAKMCELVREHLPEAQIVIGGHVANLGDLHERVSVDHIVRGEGVRWMQRYLGEDDTKPIRHPKILSGFGTRSMGVKVSDKPGEVAAALIPSVGCPLGCNFCSTSAMFGGKGKCVHFYETGDELFEVMCELEQAMKVNSFFVMDENFLFHRKRALRLLALMMEHDKAWSLYVFSSANVLRSYTMEQLVGLGISWVWMGLEGKNSQYAKLSGTDTLSLVRSLQDNGIRVLGSTIIGLEEHTLDNIDAAIDYAVSHDTEFHQFMLYTPVAGTPLYAEHKAAGTLLPESELPFADAHGQYRFAHRHPAIPAGAETELLRRAFLRDYEVNGPSIVRMIRTTLRGWRKHKNHPDLRVRARFAREARDLPVIYAGAVWAARRYFRKDPAMVAKMDAILRDLYAEFGLKSRLAAPLAGAYILRSLRKEDRRLAAGWTYEPPTFYEVKAKAASVVRMQ
ncbi:MAG TPA: cobalamin-dependent protein [Phycisphaerae bacterium]|nr:cobalamin-dependent protein [Phycisphaerae bacterium]HOJ73086.1 cobalamin-dependent protein [Phycisphaerae bacterium]HOM52702.1 cobalamin-dependent protein [Phycisphaerae bacterium]HON67693.1 cobalamin-dependent protein [Phycisphaerae bacterium]HOQ87940.1 cobalamin-dependent protein [Phycisphaerae bacterium]